MYKRKVFQKCLILITVLLVVSVQSVIASSGISLSATTYSGSEGFWAQFRIVRSGDLSGTVLVDFATMDGTATTPADYTARTGRITFNPGESEHTETITIRADRIHELSETFRVVLTRVIGSDVRLASPTSAVINIVESLPPPSLVVGQPSVKEPGPGKITVARATIYLSHPTTETVLANYSTSNGTAVAGVDYQAATGSVTFAPLEDFKVVPITIIGDGDNNEGNETFIMNATSSRGNPQGVVTIVNNLPQKPQIDFDGNTVADLSSLDTATAAWYADTIGGPFTIFGTSSDTIVPAEYTGDGRTDAAVWRSSTGVWYVFRSENSSYFAVQFGSNGDVPAPADYDGDGMSDLAVFRPSTGTWYVQFSSDGSISISQFGAVGDKPVAADFDGDWKADIAVYRSAAATGAEWWIKKSGNGAVITMTFGVTGDRALPADYTGDGKADVAVWRPSTNEWFILRSEDSSYYVWVVGRAGSMAAPGDYDGNGTIDPAAYLNNSTTRIWEIRFSEITSGSSGTAVSGNVPVASAYVR